MVKPRDIGGKRRKRRRSEDSNIERHNLRFVTIRSLRHKLSQTRRFKWPGHGCVQTTYDTTGTYHVQHAVCHMVGRNSSAVKFDRAEITCILRIFYGLKPGLEELSRKCFGFVFLHNAESQVQLCSEPLVERIFPLKLTWVLTPFPWDTLSDESIYGGLVCTHMHSITWTQEILTFMS